MEQTALRPKPMPGRGPGRGTGRGHRPHAVPRRGRRLVNALLAGLAALVLVLSGVGLGTVGATVIGMSRLAELERRTVPRPPLQSPPRPVPEPEPGARPDPGGAAVRTTLGVEAMDAPGGAGALLAGVHQPGPGQAAGCARGDVVVAFAGTRVRSAAELARAVARARPGRAVRIVVRHASGERQPLSVTPGHVI